MVRLLTFLIVLTLIHESYSQCDTTTHFEVTVTACDEYENLFGSRDALSIQFQTENQQTQWMIVNGETALPTLGASNTECVEHIGLDPMSDLGDLILVNLEVIVDSYFCMSHLEITYTTDIDGSSTEVTHTFDDEFFGDGIFMKDECDHSYRWITDDLPLMPCYDDSLTLRTYQARSIYDISIHTCLRTESAIELNALKEDINWLLMGEMMNGSEWIRSERQRLDHVLPATSTTSFNGKRLGTLVAVDHRVERDSVSNNDFTAPFDGIVIGMRLVPKNGRSFTDVLIHSDSYVYVQTQGGQNYGLLELDSEDESKPIKWQNFYCIEEVNGECFDLLVTSSTATSFFFSSSFVYDILGWVRAFRGFRYQVDLDGGTIEPDGSSTNETISDIAVDVHFIYQTTTTDAGDFVEELKDPPLDLVKEYQSPYVLIFIDDSDATFFDFQDKCQELFGTSLASIHDNGLSQAIAATYCPKAIDCWIGAQQFSQNGEDDGFWRWIDGTGTFESGDTSNWGPGEPNDDDNNEDCAVMRGSVYPRHFWNDQTCKLGANTAVALCNAPFWYPDDTRTFQFNLDTEFDLAVLLSISNSGEEPFCVDNLKAVRRNGDYVETESVESQRIGPYNWIGSIPTTQDPDTGEFDTNICNERDCYINAYAFFALPVCEINVIDIQVEDIDDGDTSLRNAEVITTECRNDNFFVESTCEVSTTVSVEETTEHSFTHSKTDGSEFSWSVGLSVEVEFKGFGIIDGINVEVSGEITSTEYEEETREWTDTTSTSVTKDVECLASVVVPPNHYIEYLLTIQQSLVTLETEETLELILCSAFTEDDSDVANIEDVSPDVIYQVVPGELVTVTASVCNVEFNTAQRIFDVGLPCYDAQALAARTGQTYMPECATADSALWDGCQCETGDKLTEAPCYCVNPDTGAILQDGKARFVETDDWRDTCILMECADSKWTASPTNAPTVAPTKAPTQPPTNAPTNSPTSAPTSLTQNIGSWIIDLDDSLTEDGSFKLINPDLNNPYEIVITIIDVSEMDILCKNIICSENDFKKDYEWTSELKVINTPNEVHLYEICASKTSNGGGSSKSNSCGESADIDICFQFFYNPELSEWENGISVSIEAEDWDFSDTMNRWSVLYSVEITCNPFEQYSEMSDHRLRANVLEYFSTNYGSNRYSSEMIDGGFIYLVNSNRALYDGVRSQVGVIYDEDGSSDSSSKSHPVFGSSSSTDASDSSGSGSSGSWYTSDASIDYKKNKRVRISGSFSKDQNMDDSHFIQLCFESFVDSLEYDTI